MSLASRVKKAWNAFMNKDPTDDYGVFKYGEIGYGTSIREDKVLITRGNERSMVNFVLNRIAIDTSSIDIKHVLADEDGNFLSVVRDDLNNCFEIDANIDQCAREFWQDTIMMMFENGHVAIVPIITDVDPRYNDGYEIKALRSGKVIEWYPNKVKIELYDQASGQKKEIVLPKDCVAIVYNPYYHVMNAPNSVLNRLTRKLNLLDIVNEQLNSNKLNIIIQLPYSIKNQLRMEQAEKRREEIEEQLVQNKYGIAYLDGTEKITQLNRPLENNLQEQIEYLRDLFYTQMGVTTDILNQTASADVMNNYRNGICEPILSALVQEMTRKFLSSNARTRGHKIMYFIDPFKLMPISMIADIGDKLIRNCICTANEFRQKLGMKPADDPGADKLYNPNMPMAEQPDGQEAEKAADDDIKGKETKSIERSNEDG